MDKGLVSGSLTLLLLKLLEKKDMYGYEMIEELKTKSNNVFELKAGSMYPLLHGLEQKKCVESYDKIVGSKLRKYYSITKDGKKFLKEKEKEWNQYADAVKSVLGGTIIA